MLKVPVPGEVTPPLVGTKTAKLGKIAAVSLPESFQRAQDQKAAEKESGSATAPVQPADGELRKRRRQPKVDEDQPDWDKLPTEHRIRVSKSKKSRTGVWIAAGLFMLALVVAALVLVAKRRKPVEPIAIAPILSEPVVIKESQPEMIELPLEMNRNEVELVRELEPLAKKFLEATSVEELLPLVRDAKRVEPKIRAFHPDGKIAAPGLSQFNSQDRIAYRGKLASVTVRTRDFAMKQLAFLRTGDGLKLDWESYAGWSEMPWKEFIAEKTDRPVLFRVVARRGDYYNFGFADDSKWQCYDMRSPDGEHVLYGYVKKDSALDVKMRPADPKAVTYMTLKLRFLPGETSKNQVVIEDYVADGWVEGAE